MWFTGFSFLTFAAVATSATLLTDSNIRYLYAKYGIELKAVLTKLHEFRKGNKLYAQYTCEMEYMQIRENHVQHVLEVGLENDSLVVFCVLLALEANFQTGQPTTLSAQSDEINSVMKTLNRFALTNTPNVVILPQLEDIPADTVDCISLNVRANRKLAIQQWISPLLLKRRKEQPALLLFFEPVGRIASNSKNAKSTLDHMDKWLTNSSATFSMDMTSFSGSKTAQLVNKYRDKYLRAVPGVEAIRKDSRPFAVVTLALEPRVTIIVPAMRHHLLPVIMKSIKFRMVEELIVVHSKRSGVTSPVLSHLKNPKIVELFNNQTDGLYGNPERTMGLANIPSSRIGWVYFLNDENLMHPNIWTIFQSSNVATTNMIMLTTEICPNYNHDKFITPTECKADKVGPIGSVIFNTRSVANRFWAPRVAYDASFIVDTCKMDSKLVKYSPPFVAAYDNGLLCKDVVLA